MQYITPDRGARWLTIWCSNDLRALRSVGCLAPPSGCLRDLFSLISSLSTSTPPGRWNRKEVLCYGKKNLGDLSGHVALYGDMLSLSRASRKRVLDLSCAGVVSSVSSTTHRGTIVVAFPGQQQRSLYKDDIQKKSTGWPRSVNGVATHAYSPVEGMDSRWVGDANCLNRRCHLICCWLLLVGTSPQSDFWCSNDLWALRSVGCLAPPSRCLRDLFLLALSRGMVPLHGYGSGKMFVLSGEERALDGTPQESAAGTQSTWLKWPLWFKQSLALSPGNWTLSSCLSVLKWQFPLLAENCLPYHQPCSYSLQPTSVLEPTCFYARYDGEC